MNIKTKRQIILDIETTGFNQIGLPYEGHKIIEIGAVEIIDRHLTENNFHVYLKPNRLIEKEALKIHGITNKFLIDKPTFKEIANEFISYIRKSELIIHNASFDIGFIEYELNNISNKIYRIDAYCKIIDSLELARKIFPGKRNNLDALCSRYEIDNSYRKFHGALIDAKILAKIYLAMTKGQMSFNFKKSDEYQFKDINPIQYFKCETKLSYVNLANSKELTDHELILDLMEKNGNCIWRRI